MKILRKDQEAKANIDWIEPTDIPVEATIDELVLMEITPSCAVNAFKVLKHLGYGHNSVRGYLSRHGNRKIILGGMIHIQFATQNEGFIESISRECGLRGDQPLKDGWIEFEDE